jgi:hypothetical protein
MRKGCTLAFWGYKDHVFVDALRTTDILNDWCYGSKERAIGDHWIQPAWSIVQNKLRDIKPPESECSTQVIRPFAIPPYSLSYKSFHHPNSAVFASSRTSRSHVTRILLDLSSCFAPRLQALTFKLCH